ncbi:LysR family transcriptional regulator [Streptomyces sp. NPDC002055]|uniref:LysR family transcriptional regulator n=1 Tax=Streptomyces sp. NPDC002055 TaxID=3154534 RepID=UPI003330097A
MHDIVRGSHMIDGRLKTLRALSATGTVTAAAETLHLTPSTVSQQLRQLQADLGVTLLEPDGRRVRLTAAAHTLLRHSDVLFAHWEQAEADLEAHREERAGSIRISAVASALSRLVAPAAALLGQQYPALTVEIGEDPEEDRIRLLLTGRADIVVTIPAADAPSPDDEAVEQHALLEEPQDLLVPAKHPAAGEEAVELGAFAEESWLRAGDPRDQHQLLLSACSAAGFVPRITHNAVDWFAVSALVSHGLGICLIPRLVPVPAGHDVVRVPLTGDVRPTRRVVAFIRRGSHERRTVNRCLTALRSAAGAWSAGHEG